MIEKEGGAVAYRDRKQAGELLARALEKFRGQSVVVYALPRGGVVIGAEIAKHLQAPLDLIIARKVGHPQHREYAVCAVTEYGDPVCNEKEAASLDPDWLQKAIAAERTEARRRRARYLEDRPAIAATDGVAIIADDGIATGLTMQAAVQEMRDRPPADKDGAAPKIVVAVPVLPIDAERTLREQGAEVVALEVPDVYLGAVGAYYETFEPVEDEEVIKLLMSVD